jgi:hypothetical protein
MSDAPGMADASVRHPAVPRYRIVQFAAYVGAVVLPLYQVIAMVAWGSPDLFQPLDLVIGLLMLAIGGAIYGVVAATAFLLFRRFFKLDGQS